MRDELDVQAVTPPQNHRHGQRIIQKISPLGVTGHVSQIPENAPFSLRRARAEASNLTADAQQFVRHSSAVVLIRLPTTSRFEIREQAEIAACLRG